MSVLVPAVLVAAAVAAVLMERARRRGAKAPARRIRGARYVDAPGFPRRDHES